MSLKNWKLISKKNVSPNSWFPVVILTFEEMDQKILRGEIKCVQTIAAWLLAKAKFPEEFTIQ